MNKKSLLLAATGSFLWGILPLYWGFLNTLDPGFILANRIVWSAVFTVLLLTCTKKLPQLLAVFKIWKTMKFLLPASVFITINWGLYIFAVNSGHVMDTSLGYYMNPLVVALVGLVVFKERCNRLEVIALLLALVGVVLATVLAGSFPYYAVIIATSFACYGACKKFAKVDSLVGVCVETLVITPFMLLFVLLAPQSRDSIMQMSTAQALLLLGGGIMTALPLILYSRGVNDLPFIVVGFLQYISPTCMFIIGQLRGEPFQLAQVFAFGFIWAGLIVFSIAMVQKGRAAKASVSEQTTDIL